MGVVLRRGLHVGFYDSGIRAWLEMDLVDFIEKDASINYLSCLIGLMIWIWTRDEAV